MTLSGNEHVRSALIETLRQGAHLLDSMADSAYGEKVPEVYDASIGGHYRHCLEHFQALVAVEGRVDYDARKRNSLLETDREQAMQATSSLLDHFERMDPGVLARSVEVRCKVSYLGDSSPWVASSLAREAVYSVVHTVHHYALIGVICGLRGIPVPDGFGVAPSTAKYQQELSKVDDEAVQACQGG